MANKTEGTHSRVVYRRACSVTFDVYDSRAFGYAMADFDATLRKQSSTMDAVGMTEQPPAVEQTSTTDQRTSEEARADEPVAEMESQQDQPEAEGEAPAHEEDDGRDTSKPTEEPCKRTIRIYENDSDQ